MRDGRILAVLVVVLAYVLLTPAPTAELRSDGAPVPTDQTRPPTADAGPGLPLVHATPPPLTVREARLAVAEGQAIRRILAYTPTVSNGGNRGREIALTFDDGPSPYTQGLLGELRRLHVPATFFPIGYAISAFPRYAARELSFGFAIGDHTLTHPLLARMLIAGQRSEILGEARRIHAYGAPYPSLMRPPYGSFNRVTTKVTRSAHMLMVLWSVDTADYTRPGVNRIVYTAVSGARPGAIILMHDGGGPRAQTVAAIPTIVRDLRRRHYRLVTVPRLMLDDPPPQPRPAPPRHRLVRPKSRPAATRAPKPRAGKPHAVKPHAARPRAAKPRAGEPHAAKPHAAKPGTGKPATAHGVKPARHLPTAKPPVRRA